MATKTQKGENFFVLEVATYTVYYVLRALVQTTPPLFW